MQRRVRLIVHRLFTRVSGTVAVILLLTVVTVACGGGAERDARAEPPDSARPGSDSLSLPVTGAPVRRGDLVLSVRATGVVRTDRLVNLKAEVQGTVAEVRVRPGVAVRSRDTLVVFDPRPFNIAVREAEAAVSEAQMRFQDALLGDRPGDTTELARQRREAARLRSGIVGAEARLEQVRLDRERAVIIAPFGGVLDQVPVVPGQRIAPGDGIARLVDIGTLTVEANVLEHDLPLIRVGAAARVVPSAGAGSRLAGTIIAVLPLVDTTSRAGRVLVRVRSGDGMLRPGMYADVQLESNRLRDRVLVPAVAVIERDGRPLVFRATQGRAAWVYVAVGRSNGSETEILADSVTGRPGVSPGDTVLVSGHLTLTHDAPIRLLPSTLP